MELYHFSNVRVNKLIPKFGENRHGGEDKRAVDKAVIWLTTDKNQLNYNDDGTPYRYKYTVIISENDQHLNIDHEMDSMVKNFNSLFDNNTNFSWYFYTNELEIDKIEEWDGKKYN